MAVEGVPFCFPPARPPANLSQLRQRAGQVSPGTDPLHKKQAWQFVLSLGEGRGEGWQGALVLVGMDVRLILFDVLYSWCLFSQHEVFVVSFPSLYRFPGRQPTPKPQSSRCLSHFPFLLRHQLDDPHLYAIVNEGALSKDDKTE